MSIAPYLREIGRGKEGARSLTREQAADLMQQVLGGQVSDVQLGGFALAMRIKGETPQELAGFLDAAIPLGLALPAPRPCVVLPSYNGARKLPNLTPLLAALLARQGVAVLVHGPRADAGRVASAEVFTALGWGLAESAEQAQARWARQEPAFMPIDVLHAPLARLLELRRALGLRNSGHTLAKLLPAVTGHPSVRVVNHTHPEYAQSLAQLLELSSADALLMRGTEGEPVAHARRRPRLAAYLGGRLSEELSWPAQEGVLETLPALPGDIDAASTARYIQGILAGTGCAPEPIAQQVACLGRMLQALSPG
ncbi:MAG TPA: DNA-binding protein YbiB [Burkholderiaceae bacterium]|nr:DNA-binding protein YbiB [Burkholderiaceae bacterium]